MIHVELYNGYARSVLLDKVEVGEFKITFGTTWSMSIYVEEAYQGKGYAKRLIQTLCKEFSECPLNKRLYIDTDASSGFWTHLGMVDNPLYDFTEDKRNVEGAGYEKYIEFSKLKIF